MPPKRTAGRPSMTDRPPEEGVRVTLLSTACYSGGWITTPELNHTAMTAAGGEDDLAAGTSNA
ncbi:hypothetical protein N7449_012144 [Penicillium cf. viridicatum]|uniref:Uncharacterized protein n=1 Tax=Penicillium cf. viridicatum TaxID=2972119 RepID=A0A9W9IQA0_9EURO|nr:hypothetical protein N7449_012144 [Penicillium cf. viridicatum]